MFDVDLHFRFLRKATEAFFEFGQASVAATAAWQSHLHSQLTSNEPAPQFAPWPAWFNAWQVAIPPMPQSSRNDVFTPFWWTAWSWAPSPVAIWPTVPNVPWSSFPWASVPWAASIPTAAIGMSPSWVPWGLYQTPMIAMMVSNGVPYAVAAPTARAGTSAMDAAGAAYAQWRLIFGNDEVPIDRDRARARIRSSTRKF